MSRTWATARSVAVVALGALFTLFALAEGLALAAEPTEPTTVRVVAAVAALVPPVGGALTFRVLGRRTSPGSAAVAAAWVALALANAALLVLLVARHD